LCVRPSPLAIHPSHLSLCPLIPPKRPYARLASFFPLRSLLPPLFVISPLTRCFPPSSSLQVSHPTFPMGSSDVDSLLFFVPTSIWKFRSFFFCECVLFIPLRFIPAYFLSLLSELSLFPSFHPRYFFASRFFLISVFLFRRVFFFPLSRSRAPENFLHYLCREARKFSWTARPIDLYLSVFPAFK